MNRLSIVMTIALVAHSLGFPHREHEHNGGSSDYQHGNIGGHGGHGSNHELSGSHGHGQGDSIGHGLGGGTGHGLGGSTGHGLGGSTGHGLGGSIGHGQGGLGHGNSYGGRESQQFESGSHGGSSNLNVATGFSNKRVESIDSGSQLSGGGSSSGYQQNGGRLIGGHAGTHHNGGSGFATGAGNSQFESQSGRQKGLVVEESSGFTSINKNQGGFQDNQRGSSIGSSGGHSSRY